MEFVPSAVAVVALLLALWAAWYVRRAVSEAGRSARTMLGVAGREWFGALFRLSHVSRHRYVLRNDGNSTAYGVRVDVGDLVRHEGAAAIDEFPPGRAEKYMLIQPLQLRVTEIRVTWHDRQDRLDAPRSVRLPLELPTDRSPSEL
ncbi:hypothetical protein [Jiangella asiatica]|uniref:Uncharacterized protein n=1 Tax=Jiangella asiatica TaxID=2530372 RepID=A0A4R5DJP6_9ACTN|nr:hypothetical protein [Jiangella asiatica]TDE13577.1 hypothetical protein E1269_05995 [Jiangella asiatica]